MGESTKEIITPVAWDRIVKRRIPAMCPEWNTLLVDDRFWLVHDWLNEYHVFEPTTTKRHLLVVKPYWQERCPNQHNQ